MKKNKSLTKNTKELYDFLHRNRHILNEPYSKNNSEIYYNLSSLCHSVTEAVYRRQEIDLRKYLENKIIRQ